MSAEDIEASKAPLMDHLIELRSRLIKALLGFGVAFIFCFFFAKQIYNVLVWPFVWVAGAEHSKFIYTALLEYFITQLKLELFGAGSISAAVLTPRDVLSESSLALPLLALYEGSIIAVRIVEKRAAAAAATPPSSAPPPPAANPAE